MDERVWDMEPVDERVCDTDPVDERVSEGVLVNVLKEDLDCEGDGKEERV